MYTEKQLEFIISICNKFNVTPKELSVEILKIVAEQQDETMLNLLFAQLEQNRQEKANKD